VRERQTTILPFALMKRNEANNHLPRHARNTLEKMLTKMVTGLSSSVRRRHGGEVSFGGMLANVTAHFNDIMAQCAEYDDKMVAQVRKKR
jgi:hypothetical protein